MSTVWALYQKNPSFVLAFHGTEQAIANKVLLGEINHFNLSQGKKEWLGHGIYFWENDPLRGQEWAESGKPKKAIDQPDVIGAVIDLGNCLDLTTRSGLLEVKQAFEILYDTYSFQGKTLPRNSGGADLPSRELDCEVIQTLHQYRKLRGQIPYDTVRATFPEDQSLYPGAGFRLRNHTQIAVINIRCIKGYFKPIKSL